MILVTGTKRSGTSMWMQILIAAGFPAIGSAFPAAWDRSIKEANPKGFYESLLRQGIYFATNPHPETGHFLFPASTREHVVKVFVPGLVRTDVAFLDRVLGTVRHWRDYGASLKRLQDMEDAWMEEHAPKAAARPDPRPQLPPAIEWWFENYELLRDLATRRYPVHLVTYDRLLDDPEREIGLVLRWLGRGDLQAACEAVDPDLRTQRASRAEQAPEDVAPEDAEVFDLLYDLVHRGGDLSPALAKRFNEANARLEERYWPQPEVAAT